MLLESHLPVRSAGLWLFETTEPVVFDVIAGRIIVPEGFSFYIGAKILGWEVRLPPIHPGLLKSALLHDYLYSAWADRVAGLYHADAAMMAEMKRHAVPLPLRLLVWLVISIWSAMRSRDAAL